MPIEREILNMFELNRNSKIAISVHNHFDEDAFRCFDTYNRKNSIALWESVCVVCVVCVCVCVVCVCVCVRVCVCVCVLVSVCVSVC